MQVIDFQDRNERIRTVALLRASSVKLITNYE